MLDLVFFAGMMLVGMVMTFMAVRVFRQRVCVRVALSRPALGARSGRMREFTAGRDASLAMALAVFMSGELLCLLGAASLAFDGWTCVPLAVCSAWLFLRDRAVITKPRFRAMRAAVRKRAVPTAKVCEAG